MNEMPEAARETDLQRRSREEKEARIQRQQEALRKKAPEERKLSAEKPTANAAVTEKGEGLSLADPILQWKLGFVLFLPVPIVMLFFRAAPLSMKMPVLLIGAVGIYLIITRWPHNE